MPVVDKSYCKHLELSEAVVYKSEPKMSSNRQQTADVLREKMFSTRENRNLNRQAKLKTQTQISQPYLNPLYDLHGSSVYEQKVQVKSSTDCQQSRSGSSASKDEELVKYMTKIPGYLQQVDKGTNIQGRALNFGVLDFTSLEKWKYNERMPGRRHQKLPSSDCNSLPVARRHPRFPTNLPPRKQPYPGRLHVNASHDQKLSEDAQQSKKVENFPDAPNPKDQYKKGLHRKVKSATRSFSEIDISRSKWKELDEKPISSIKAFSVVQDRQPKLGPARPRDGIHNTREKEKKKGGLTHHPHHMEQQNIVLLVPKYSSKLSCSESSQLEPRTSYDGQFEAVSRSRSPDRFSLQELHSNSFVPEVPNSRELPTFEEINADNAMISESSMETSCIKSDVNRVPCPNGMQKTPNKSEARSPKENKSNSDPSVSSEPPGKMDLEAAELGKVRHPSPNRRFSFSLGRLSRSFSFKDSSSLPQLSSTYVTVKSGPICSDTSAGTGDFNRDKASSIGRGRSSPLRRLLDPLMKTRGTQSAEAVQPTSGIKNFASPISTEKNEFLQVKNHGISKFQALLQLSVKNYLPFFKLVVDNSSDILAAAVKSMGKDDLSMTYAFYSVREIKKKSIGWMSQGSKSKNCSFGYDSIGQMKISCSYTSDSNPQDSCNSSLVTESVLYDVDPRKEDVKSSELSTSMEVAAIIVKNPVKKLDQGETVSDQYKQKNYTHSSLGCNNNFSSTLVILPGGVHGVPNQGAPSSLVDRWTSGGSCDCGGWDIGCKLRVFSDKNLSSENLSPSMSSLDRVNLFSQGSKPESKPIFSLAPFKNGNGLFSVEFDASMSLPEAFSTCVAIITTTNFSDILELKSLSGENHFSEVMAGSKSTRTPIAAQEQLPAKYITCPPASPVGRI